MTLQKVKEESFGNVVCDFYRNGKHDIWMTRSQIGEALEYAHPREAIQKVHERNKDRLDNFSREVKMTSVDGKERNIVIYSTKGVFEICRWSKQPKANAFLDWVWDIVEAVHLGEVKRVEDYDKKMLNAIDPLKLLGLDDSKERIKYYSSAMHHLVQLAKIANYPDWKVEIERHRIKEELGIGS